MNSVALYYRYFITGPPTHSVGGQTSNGRRRLSSSSVTLHGGPAGSFLRAGQVMTSYQMQSNYSFTVTLHGGPVVLCPVRVTVFALCFYNIGLWTLSILVCAAAKILSAGWCVALQLLRIVVPSCMTFVMRTMLHCTFVICSIILRLSWG